MKVGYLGAFVSLPAIEREHLRSWPPMGEATRGRHLERVGIELDKETQDVAPEAGSR